MRTKQEIDTEYTNEVALLGHKTGLVHEAKNQIQSLETEVAKHLIRSVELRKEAFEAAKASTDSAAPPERLPFFVKKHKFLNDATYMPITMDQFQALTNELLVPLNEVAKLHCTEDSKGFNGDYMAQIVMSAIHAYKHEVGVIYKGELFESCINRISCHVTFHAVEEIRKRLSTQ